MYCKIVFLNLSSLDFSFLPKELVYTYKTIDQSYSELQKKTQELQTYFKESEFDEEEEEVRVSRPSYKQRREITPIRAPKKKQPVRILSNSLLIVRRESLTK